MHLLFFQSETKRDASKAQSQCTRELMSTSKALVPPRLEQGKQTALLRNASVEGRALFSYEFVATFVSGPSIDREETEKRGTFLSLSPLSTAVRGNVFKKNFL